MSESSQPPSGPPTLRTARLVLRPFTAADAPAIQKYAGAPEVASTTTNIPHPYPDGGAEEWIATHAEGWKQGRQLTLAITSEAAGLVGAVGLMIEPDHHRAELGYWVGVPFWGRGYATEAAEALLAYAFDNLDLHRVEASFFSRNPASGRVMEKIGMRKEGVRRECVRKDGVFEDLVIYALLASER